jgi:hypothetical protein
MTYQQDREARRTRAWLDVHAAEQRAVAAARTDDRLDELAGITARLPQHLSQAHRRRLKVIAVELLRRAGVAVLLLAIATPAAAADGCRPEPVTPETPSGLAGCVVYGEGIASTWPGPGAARNDCVYPWTSCTTIAITSLDTGLRIVVTPTMFCDCYQRPGPNGEQRRIVDLDQRMVYALGLDPADGLWPVLVEPAAGLPDTAVRP